MSKRNSLAFKGNFKLSAKNHKPLFTLALNIIIYMGCHSCFFCYIEITTTFHFNCFLLFTLFTSKTRSPSFRVKYLQNKCDI